MSALKANSYSKSKPRIVVQQNVRLWNRPVFKIGIIAIIGMFSVLGVNVAIMAQTSAQAYQLVSLKNEKLDLNTKADVVGSQVSSLSSNQNLVNVAHALGMVSNVNPVFLRLSDSTVIGEPKRALANERTVAKNLVPNSAMTVDTKISKSTGQNQTGVLGSNASGLAVSAAGPDSIQASPTN